MQKALDRNPEGLEPEDLEYDEIIVSQGILIPFVPSIITPKIERPLRNNKYEGGEARTLAQLIQEGDVVLEFGAGLGLCSSVAAANPLTARVVTLEANPDLLPLIRETHRLNALTNVEVRNGIVAAESGDVAKFYLRPDFWASSMEPHSRGYKRVVELACHGINDLLEEIRPTVIVCDIEGAELGLFDNADLSGVRAIICELHPKVYGLEGQQKVIEVLAEKGLRVPEDAPAGTVLPFLRGLPEKKAAEDQGPVSADVPAAPLPAVTEDPKVFLPTCMKNEGPFILEWLAWQKALGVTDIVVFTNDLSDGSGALLDHLQDMGELTHLPNPAVAVGATNFQPVALRFAQLMPQCRQADYAISLDVDEFLDIRVGDGTLSALLAATEPFDALSVSEINHGTNGHETYQEGWVTELFPGHQTLSPGNQKARRGVKTISRLGDRIKAVRNHRPDLLPGIAGPVWLDGSGQRTTHFLEDESENGHDVRGTYDLAVLQHFPLRSIQSYLVKLDRGDVVAANRKVGRRYFKQRDTQEYALFQEPLLGPKAHAYYDSRFVTDPRLMELHAACVAGHKARIAQLLRKPKVVSELEWMRERHQQVYASED